MDASSDRAPAPLHNRVQKRDQLRQGLLNLIRVNGEGGRLPSERELSEQFDVARETLRRCLGELEREGLLERRQGAGTFVANVPVVKPLQLMSFSEDMRQRGLTPSSEVLSSRVVRAGAKLAHRLKVGPGAELIEIRRLRLADGQPMALEQVSLARSLVPGLDPETLATRSLYEVLEQQFGLVIRSATQEIAATVLSEDEADLLEVPAFSPALLVERQVLTAQGDIVEYGKTLYRADRYRFEINVARSGLASGMAAAAPDEADSA